MVNEAYIRFGAFFGIFTIMIILESVLPKRKRSAKRMGRWWANLSMVVLSTLIVRLFMQFLPIIVAADLESTGSGLLNSGIVPWWLAVVIGIILLDLIIYAQHMVFHRVPLLWKLHMVHHTDVDLDVTTALRFHPVEIIFSVFIKLAAVVIFGIPAFAVLIFEVILNGMAMFNHANLGINKKVDEFLRIFVVTPDMHRVHHSIIFKENDNNFGFNLSIWDRLFDTYTAQPKGGHLRMLIGLKDFKDRTKLGLWNLLKMPFIKWSQEEK